MTKQRTYRLPSRRGGRTTEQMRRAPIGAVYIWGNTSLDYPRQLADTLGRADLQIVSPGWLMDGNVYGRHPKWLILDHSAELTESQYKVLAMAKVY